MTVHFVGAGPGATDLITLRGLKLLEQTKVCIWAGSLVNPELLGYLPRDAVVHDSAGLNLDETTAICIEAHAAGLDVVRLHTGDPSLYGAIREQQQRLDAAGIPYCVVPGVSSFQAAAATLGCELTIPAECQSVVLTRIGGRTDVPEREGLERFAETGATLCLFLSIGQIKEVVARLIPALGGDCPIAVVYRASWPDEIIIRSTLSQVAAEVSRVNVTRQAMILVGNCLRSSGPASRLYDPAFCHGYRNA